MKKYRKLLVLVHVLALAACSFAACGSDEEEPADDTADAATAMWVDEYVSLLESGEKTEYANYDAIMQVMRDYQTETGSKYIYCVEPTDPNNLEGKYNLTVDASTEPDPWGTDYGFEIQFKEAAEGEVTAARSAWQDNEEGTEWCWSTFAPVRNSDGEIVAIVGIDYPAPIISEYPEWDRNNKEEWNGEEAEWPENMPEELQTFVDGCKDRVSDLANQLGTQEIEIKS